MVDGMGRHFSGRAEVRRTPDTTTKIVYVDHLHWMRNKLIIITISAIIVAVTCYLFVYLDCLSSVCRMGAQLSTMHSVQACESAGVAMRFGLVGVERFIGRREKQRSRNFQIEIVTQRVCKLRTLSGDNSNRKFDTSNGIMLRV